MVALSVCVCVFFPPQRHYTCLHSPEEISEEPEPIISRELIVNSIQWNPNPETSSNASTATPPGCPPGLQYVSRAQCTPLIHFTHSSLGTGHPRANSTLSLLKDLFWWPNMARDVSRFVQGCSDCAIAKSPCHLPSGKLLLLPVPNRPWSHLGMDFITDLPVSDGNICVSSGWPFLQILSPSPPQESSHGYGDCWTHV